MCRQPSILVSIRLIISLLSLLPVGCRKRESSNLIGNTHLKVELLQSSSIPTLEEIAPYEEALTINEYKIIKVIEGPQPKLGKIRVAHWAVTGTEILPISNRTSKSSTLWISPLASISGINAVYLRNDLLFDPDENLYYDLTPIPKSYSSPKNIRYEYQSNISLRMPIYWKLRNQLKLVVIGNSQTACGVNQKRFQQLYDDEFPAVLSLSPAGSGVPFQCLIANQYLANLPELKWVVWGVSSRIFSQSYAVDRRAKIFQRSPGYQYDRQHWNELTNRPTAHDPINLQQLKASLSKTPFTLGWSKKKNRGLPNLWNKTTHNKICAKISRRNFKWNQDAWLQFYQSVKNLSQKGINVLLFTPPYHPAVTKLPVVDGDGTGNADYQLIVRQLQELSKKTSNIHFIDIHKNGHHQFKHLHFSDIDHLHISGAKILTEELADFIKNAAKSGSQ